MAGQEALRTTLTPGFGQPGTAAPRRRFNTRPYDVSSLEVAISGGASIPGPVLLRRKRWEDAEQAWREAVAADEDDARSGFAGLLQQRERWEEAEQAWREAVAAGERRARSGFARFLQQRERWGEAEQAWREAVAADEDDARPGFARFLQQRERWGEAEQAWREAVAAGKRGAWSDLAGFLQQRKPWQEAEQAWRARVRVPGPESPHQKRTHHDRLRPGDQQGRPDQDQLRGAVLAAAHPD